MSLVHDRARAVPIPLENKEYITFLHLEPRNKRKCLFPRACTLQSRACAGRRQAAHELKYALPEEEKSAMSVAMARLCTYSSMVMTAG